MKHLKLSAIVMYIIYLITAFVQWDIQWIAQLPYWSPDQRSALLVCVLFIIVLTRMWLWDLIRFFKWMESK